MQDRKGAKANLLSMLDGPIDNAILPNGFKRKGKSIAYRKKLEDVEQEINFYATFFPRYNIGAEAHIQPMFALKNSSVTKKALELANGNEAIVGGTSGLILNQDIQFAAPSDKHESWYAKDSTGYYAIGLSICKFMDSWLYGLLKDTDSLDAFINAFESSDPRVLRQKHGYVYATAACLLRGERARGQAIMETFLGKPGLRKMYAAVYENLLIGS